MQNGVTAKLRQLADDLETGKYKDWVGNMTLSRPEVELDPMSGECELDNLRHFRVGDEITVVLVLTAPKKTT